VVDDVNTLCVYIPNYYRLMKYETADMTVSIFILTEGSTGFQ